MNFEPVFNPDAQPDHTNFGRNGNSEITVFAPPTGILAFVWKGIVRPGDVQEAWNKTKLELVSAACDLWNAAPPPITKVAAIGEIENFAAVHKGDDEGNFGVQMRVQSGKGEKPAPLNIWGTLANSYRPPDHRVGAEMSQENWEQPEIQKFVLSLFQQTYGADKISVEELSGLAAKIDELVRPASDIPGTPLHFSP